jgi:hypothetical protein
MLQVVHELTKVDLWKVPELAVNHHHLIVPAEKRRAWVNKVSSLSPQYFIVDIQESAKEIHYK